MLIRSPAFAAALLPVARRSDFPAVVPVSLAYGVAERLPLSNAGCFDWSAAASVGSPAVHIKGAGKGTAMKGWRARLGFLIPPGNPTIEPEMAEMAPRGTSVHFSRMVAPGAGGTHQGQEERNRSQIEHIEETAELLVKVKPDVMMLAHTASSYTLGRQAEVELLQRLQALYRTPVATAFGSVVAALNAFGAKRVALGAPYSEEMTLRGKTLLEEHGFEVVRWGCLENVTNIFEETPERAYRLGRTVDAPEAEAVFLSGLGMPTISTLEMLEQDLRKPTISAASAMMWRALQLAGVRHAITGYGRLLASEL